MLGCVTDGFLNGQQYLFAFNQNSLNLGSWSSFLPFASPDHQSRYAEALVWGTPMYAYYCIGVAIVGAAVVNRLRARRPDISNVAALSVIFVGAFIFDFVTENAIIRLSQGYSFVKTPESLTLWAGSQHQFPIYESIFVATLGVFFTYLKSERPGLGRRTLLGGARKRAAAGWPARPRRLVRGDRRLDGRADPDLPPRLQLVRPDGRLDRRSAELHARHGLTPRSPTSVGCAAMSTIDELVANNERFAAGLAVKHLDVEPKRQLAIVTCMDSRLDVFNALGLGEGEAHILRNAGGVITDDVIRSLSISQRRLGTREVMLIQHTDCGMQKLTDDGFRSELQEATGTAPPFAIESFDDVETNVRQSILRVRRSEFLAHRDVVRGFVYDVDTHKLTEVEVG